MLEFSRLFRGATHKHGLLKYYDFDNVNKRTGKITKKATAVLGPPDYDSHLAGEAKQGVYTTFDSDRCLFGTLDIDEYIFDDPKEVEKLRSKVKEMKLPCVVCRSSNGGAHLHFHFQDKVQSYLLKPKLDALGKALGYEYEVFPKQPRLKPGEDGNFVFLPLYPKRPNLDSRSEEPVCDTYAFDDDGNYITTKEAYEAYANTKLCKSVDCIKVDPPKEDIVVNDLKTDMDESPPCVKALYDSKLKDGDGRNDAMFAFAMFEKKRKNTVTVKDLATYNQSFKDPLPHKEIQRIVSQVMKPTYKIYNCNARTLEKVCDKETCKMMKYGIGKKDDTDYSYYDNFTYIKDGGPFIVKHKPMRKILSPAECRHIMKVERGMIQRGPSWVHPFDVYENRIANKTAVNETEWQPGKPELYEKPGPNGSIKVYNGYIGPIIKPMEGDVSPYLDFVERRIQNKVCREWYIDFKAHAKQKPGEKVNAFVLLISNTEGTGKSLEDEIMQVQLGPHNCNNVDLKDMASGWGDVFLNKLWISFEEIHDIGANRKAIANTIKRITTIKSMTGNMKYGKFAQGEMFARLNFMTNEDTAITIKRSSRRPFVYRLDNDDPKYIEENQAEGDMLVDWLRNDHGHEKIAHYLLTRDISNFNPKARPPETEAKIEMVRRTHGYKFKDIISAWKSKSWPFTQQCQVYCPQHIAKLLRVDEEEIEDCFRDSLGCKSLKRVQNCEFEVWEPGTDGKQYQLDYSRQDLSLWTDDEELLNQKSSMKPKDVIKLYLHPCTNGAKKLFAQDRRVNTNLLNNLNKLD